MPDQNGNKTPSGASKLGRQAGPVKAFTKGIALFLAAACLSMPLLFVSASQASAETRSLKLYFVHTKERANIVFKRNGKFDPKGLQQVNHMLRDWRRNEPTKMDPRLLDLVWEVYRRSGASDYIHVVSAYRSPATNGMLRSRSKGVAKNSQHMLGKAMDFYIPGVKLKTLRQIAMKMQIGGVGYYPTSGSPFVHLDVAGVRAWPRMSRQELASLFPDGNTVHLPADGKPLPGYQQALAAYKKRLASGNQVEIASASKSSSRKRPNLFAVLFGGGDEDEDADVIAAPAPAERPAPAARTREPVMVAANAPQELPGVEIAAPVPMARPSFKQGGGPGTFATALYSPARSTAQEALQAALPDEPLDMASAESEFIDLQQYAIPVPTLLGQRKLTGDADIGVVMAATSGDLPEKILAAIPLPSMRPMGSETLLSSADAGSENDSDLDEQQALTPSVIAALVKSDAYIRSDLPSPSAGSEKPQTVEMAAIDPEEDDVSISDMRFGDGFDVPREAAVVRKGGRSPGSATEEAVPALTGDLVAKWAVNNNRVADVASIKAPRVVTRTLSGEYFAAYAAGGFKPVARTASIDLDRFSNEPTSRR